MLLGSLLVFVYPVARLSHWSAWVSGLGWPSTLTLWFGSVIALRIAFTGRSPLLQSVMVNWLGLGLILCCVCLGYELLRLLLPLDDAVASRWIALVTALLVAFAIVVANRFRHRRIHIHSTKLNRNYHIVHLSDVHIGSRSPRFLERLVHQVNGLTPDFVVITGDLVDTSRVGKQELRALSSINATTLFCVGNHDRYAGLDRLLPILGELGVRVLRDRTDDVGSDDLQFIAIDDAEAASHVATTLPQIPSSEHRFRVLLYHRPDSFETVVDAGIELMLSGHTHHGQIWPFNWLVKQQFSRYRGLHEASGEHGLSRLYVSPGTGTWGPTMRLGTYNEITSIHLTSTTVDRNNASSQ